MIFWEINILGVDILGIDIMRVDILKTTQLSTGLGESEVDNRSYCFSSMDHEVAHYLLQGLGS